MESGRKPELSADYYNYRSEGLVSLSSQVENLTPQLVNAGTIKINYPENKAADENFENLRKQYAAGVQSIR